MKWYRSNVKHGSRTALFALVIQLVLSFGHVHGITPEATPARQSVVAQSVVALSGAASGPACDAVSGGVAITGCTEPRRPASDHDSDQHGDDVCAICFVMAMASTVSFAMPPVLLLPREPADFTYVSLDPEFTRTSSVYRAFQPRAPPTA